MAVEGTKDLPKMTSNLAKMLNARGFDPKKCKLCCFLYYYMKCLIYHIINFYITKLFKCFGSGN